MNEHVKGKSDVTFCIETFNDLKTTKVEVSGNVLELMTVFGAALIQDKDLMDLVTTIVMSSKEFEQIEKLTPSNN
jgi:hypothetical protein